MSESEQNGYGQPLPIKLSKIERFEGQPRRFFDEEKISDLADNIQTEGQKTPVKVCKHATKSGIFVLIGGERRWRAFHLIQKRTGKEPTVNAFIDVVHDHNHHFREALVDNLHREDLIPLDEADALNKLNQENKLSIIEIAKIIGRSVTYVEGRIKVHSLPEQVKNMMRSQEDQLSITAAVDIARSTSDPHLRIEIAREVTQRGLGILEVRQLIQSRTGHIQNGEVRKGRVRRASDDYVIFNGCIERFLRDLQVQTGNFDVAKIYDTRQLEEFDRSRDSRTIQMIISKLEEIYPKVKETSKLRLKRTGRM